MANTAIGAALQFTQEELGGPCVENESSISVLTASTLLVQGSGDRVGLVLINTGSSDVVVNIGPPKVPPSGILLTANGGSVAMTVRDDFTLPSRTWYGQGQGGNSTVYVLELVRYSIPSLGGNG